jgi:hypothetical protein
MLEEAVDQDCPLMRSVQRLLGILSVQHSGCLSTKSQRTSKPSPTKPYLDPFPCTDETFSERRRQTKYLTDFTAAVRD